MCSAGALSTPHEHFFTDIHCKYNNYLIVFNKKPEISIQKSDIQTKNELRTKIKEKTTTSTKRIMTGIQFNNTPANC